jgi:hypothetical protein
VWATPGPAELILGDAEGEYLVPVSVWERDAGVSRSLRGTGQDGATERRRWFGRVHAVTAETPERPPVERVVCRECHTRVRTFRTDDDLLALRCACGIVREVGGRPPVEWSG